MPPNASPEQTSSAPQEREAPQGPLPSLTMGALLLRLADTSFRLVRSAKPSSPWALSPQQPRPRILGQAEAQARHLAQTQAQAQAQFQAQAQA